MSSGIKRLERLDATVTWIDGCASDLTQVFVNLIRNALDAMKPMGILWVQTRNVAGGVEIAFSDDGHGIAPDTRPHVFEAFFTTKNEREGTGLGLAICRRIVEDHRGTIDAESAIGSGTTFRIWLPSSRPLRHPENPTGTQREGRVEAAKGAPRSGPERSRGP